MSPYENDILSFLHSKGLTRDEIKNQIENAKNELATEETNEKVKDFCFALRRHILDRFDDLDFSFDNPETFVEKCLFTPIKTWNRLASKLDFRRDRVENYKALSEIGAEFNELSNNWYPNPLKVFNKASFNDNFDLGLNGFKYFMEVEFNDWKMIGHHGGIFLYKDNSNWIFMSEKEIHIAINNDVYTISKEHPYDSVNKFTLDIKKVQLCDSELDELNNHQNETMSVGSTEELSVVYICKIEPLVDSELPIFNQVRVKKSFPERKFIGFYINKDTLNYQKFLYPKALMSDNEVYVSSIGYIDDKISYCNIGILHGSMDNIDLSYDFEDKVPYAVHDIALNIAMKSGVRCFTISSSPLPLDYGYVRSRTLPKGRMQAFIGEDRYYIKDALREFSGIETKSDDRSLYYDNFFEITSEESLIKLTQQ